VVAVMMMAAAMVMVGASSAQAAPAACPSPAHNNNDPGYGVMTGSFDLKDGPYAVCADVASLDAGDTVYLWCWVQNSHGNYWWWVRIAGTQTYGWMSENNMYIYETLWTKC
jgi:uncharacterized membrane protein